MEKNYNIKSTQNLDQNFSQTIIRLNKKINQLRESIHNREQDIINREEEIKEKDEEIKKLKENINIRIADNNAMDKQLKDLETQIINKNFETWKNID
jgi:peptidoglycan hydrolase CwlO-like protein